MSVWREVRQQAQRWHAVLTADTAELVPAEDILAAAERDTGIRREARAKDDALLDKAEAVYDPDSQKIYYSKETDAALAAYYVAHEYAHHRLDAALARCAGGDIDLATPAEPELSLVGEDDAYSPKERREAQANLFARELLLPRAKLRWLCASSVFDAQAIATDLGVPLDLVMQQLADALLLPEEREGTEAPQAEPPPDEFQRVAAEAACGPLRIRAGPGTGKTRTLVGRVKHLIECGTDPKQIAVLTFSNLAAQDLGARIRAAVGSPATAIWAGTFHAFGLELLRKYGEAIGLPIELRLLDRSASLMLLEDRLGDLDLQHYLDLSEPLRKLRSVLALISRAKDELISPTKYEERARAMLAAARDERERIEGLKAVEVARAYQVYEAELRTRGAVDFGDLIARPVELLQGHPDIRDAVRAARPHILVDEYQDMNRASGILLRELVPPGAGPWVVGDVRQAIYRFRGASPLNMTRFPEDFPNAVTHDLGVNYRSGGHIVRAFQAFGDTMQGVTEKAVPLDPSRGKDAGIITLNVAATMRAEYEGIARQIHSHASQGGRFSQHAILARSHTTLARLARHLEQAGVPCLYFGDFFERPEIRDLLSLLSLAAGITGIGLVRIAHLPQYVVPASDVATLFAWRKQNDVRMIEAIRRLDEIEGISAAGRQPLERLRDDLREVDFMMSAHRFLLLHLFRHGAHLQALLADVTVAGQQRRLAIYQLLQFAFAFRARPGIDPKRAFLEHIRRLEMLDEEKQLRQLPAAASDINAVRMMTIHAAKGLQFPIVHVPALTSRHFPSKQGDRNALPPGLIDESALMSRDAEEEALFFVAMSRARDELHLTRAVNCGGRGWDKLGPSPFLEQIAAHLPIRPNAPPTWTEEGAPELPWQELDPPAARQAWPATSIETYLDCPRRFYYADVLGLEGFDARGPYLKFHSALKATLGWIRQTPSAAERAQGLSTRFEADWQEKGPRTSALESVYRAAAETMLATATKLMQGEALPNEFALTVRGDIVLTCNADHVERRSDGITIQRMKAGALARTGEAHKVRHIVAQAAVREQHPGQPVRFEHVSLQDGAVQEATLQSRKLTDELKKIEAAFQGIEAGRFPPKPDDFLCPSCPYFFICPSHFPRATG